MQIVPLESLSPPSIPSVDTAEIAFAMALFDAAVNGKVHAPDIASSGFPLREGQMESLEEPDLELSGAGADADGAKIAGVSRAISVLWHHYHGDDRQRTIWSRIVAFEAMKAGAAGWTTSSWAQLSLTGVAAASANPAVVHAVANEPLLEFGQFDALRFQQAVEWFAAPIAEPSASALPAAEVAVQFRVAESLLRPVENITGRRSVESLLSRALATARLEFPWLNTVCFKGSACLVAFSSMNHMPSAAQIAGAEAALVRSLVSLLRNIVGQSVTLNLVKSLASESMTENWFEGLSV